MLALLFALTPLLDNNLLLFVGGVIIPSAIELAGGWRLYELYHARWWDYTDRPFNIGGFICLEFSLYWGLGSVFIMKLVHPTIAALVGIVPTPMGWEIGRASCRERVEISVDAVSLKKERIEVER